MKTYKTFEEQIKALWKSRGLEVVEEKVYTNRLTGMTTWMITARGKKNV
jgi:hypothetical protein